MTEKQSPTMMMTPDQLRGLVDEQPIGYVTANGMRMLIQDEATVMLYRHDYLIRPDHIPLYTHPAPATPRAELNDDEILDTAIAAGLRFSMYGNDVETWATIKRLVREVERAHGIGGSDE